MAIACEQPSELDLPFSRLSVPDVHRQLEIEHGPEACSESSIRRILRERAIKPWKIRGWIHRRAPDFEERANQVLELYEGYWQGEPLGDDDLVICADEKPNIQALERATPSSPVGPGRSARVEFEYVRHGTQTLFGALDITRGRIRYRLPEKSTKKNFRMFVTQIMSMEPYQSARRVFWIVDNGSCHHRNTFGVWLAEAYPNAIAVHTPVHASWLNQIEIFFSSITRKALTPRNFPSVKALKDRIRRFIRWCNEKSYKVNWRFSRKDLLKILEGDERTPSV